jgi:hypothetical protein
MVDDRLQQRIVIGSENLDTLYLPPSDIIKVNDFFNKGYRYASNEECLAHLTAVSFPAVKELNSAKQKVLEQYKGEGVRHKSGVVTLEDGPREYEFFTATLDGQGKTVIQFTDTPSKNADKYGVLLVKEDHKPQEGRAEEKSGNTASKGVGKSVTAADSNQKTGGLFSRLFGGKKE